ncbi:Cytochrome P450 82A3, partial [Mucuna pruriens]
MELFVRRRPPLSKKADLSKVGFEDDIFSLWASKAGFKRFRRRQFVFLNTGDGQGVFYCPRKYVLHQAPLKTNELQLCHVQIHSLCYWHVMRKLATIELLSNHWLELLKCTRTSEIEAAIRGLHKLYCSENGWLVEHKRKGSLNMNEKQEQDFMDLMLKVLQCAQISSYNLDTIIKATCLPRSSAMTIDGAFSTIGLNNLQRPIGSLLCLKRIDLAVVLMRLSTKRFGRQKHDKFRALHERNSTPIWLGLKNKTDFDSYPTTLREAAN